jgi:hypothetical protein
MQERRYACTVVAAAKAVGVTKQAYYEWHRTPAFRAWWNEQLERWMAEQKHRVLATLLGGATERFQNSGKEPDAKPDAALVKLFLERFDAGYAPRQRKEITGALEVNHSAMLQAVVGGSGFARPPLIEAAFEALDAPKPPEIEGTAPSVEPRATEGAVRQEPLPVETAPIITVKLANTPNR